MHFDCSAVAKPCECECVTVYFILILSYNSFTFQSSSRVPAPFQSFDRIMLTLSLSLSLTSYNAHVCVFSIVINFGVQTMQQHRATTFKITHWYLHIHAYILTISLYWNIYIIAQSKSEKAWAHTHTHVPIWSIFYKVI